MPTKGREVPRKRTLRDSGLELTRSWRGALPVDGRDALRQFLILFFAYVAYDVARIAVHGREAAAMANAQHIISAERALYIYVEPWIQTQASHVQAVLLFFNWFYANMHLPVTILTLTWIYLYRNEAWALFRNVFLTMNACAMVVYAVLPVAPPRLVPTTGIVDTLFLFSKSNYQSGILSMVTNPFAAFPSLHIGYALFCTLAVYLLTRNRLVRVLAAVYPVFVLGGIIITGNHYLLDAVAGAVVLAIAFAANYAVAPDEVPEAIAVASRWSDEG